MDEAESGGPGDRAGSHASGSTPRLDGTGRGSPQRERLASGLRTLVGQPVAAAGTLIFVLFLALAVIGPVIVPYGLNEEIVADARQPPSAKHWFGTDNLGRDVFSRVILGVRDVLSLAGLGTLLAVAMGTSLGLVTGYQGKLLDELLLRFFDSLLALPALLLALLLLGSLGPSPTSVLIVIVVVYTPIVTRVIRSVVLSVKSQAFVEAAQVQGEALGYILFREILPSTLPTLAVEAALRFSYAIFLVASLGFLGVGVQPPSANWGLMVQEAQTNATQTPWALFFPAGAIAIVVIGINLMADGLRQVLQAPSQLGG
jgi:peptide/nickel transport system permease protein